MLNKLQNLPIYILIALLPILVFPYSPNPTLTGKLTLIFAFLGVFALIKAVLIFITKKAVFHFGYFDVSIIFLLITYLASTFLKTPNLMDAFIFPGPTTIIILSVILYFIILQFDANHKKWLIYSLLTSALITSIIILLSLTKIFSLPDNINPINNLLALSVFLFSTIPLFVSQILKENQFLNKFLLTATGALTLFAFGLSILFILPGKSLAPKNLPLNTSWDIALGVLKESPVLGIGSGNYLEAFNRYKNSEFNLTDLWDKNFYSGSSFAITTLTETGLLGLIALLIFTFGIILFSYKKLKERKLVGWGIISSFDLLSTLILTISLYIFPLNIISIITLFILLGIVSEKNKQSDLVWVPFLILIFLITYQAYRFSIGEYYFYKAQIALSKNNAQETYNFTKKAVAVNPKVDRYHLFLAKINYGLASTLAQKEKLTDDERNQIALFVQESINESKAGVTLNNKKSNNWEELGKTYKSLMPFAGGSAQYAVESYKQAIALNPTNPNLRIALGDVYFLDKNYENAIENYKLAVYAKDNLANAHYNLGLAYKAKGETGKAKKEFETTLSLLDNTSKEYKTVQSELESINKD